MGIVTDELSSENDIKVKVGVNGIDIEFGLHTIKKFIKIKRGGANIVRLPGGKYTLLIRWLKSDVIRYSLLDNQTGQVAQMGEI